jgi:phage terminase small subunit
MTRPTNIKALSGTLRHDRDAAKIEALENLPLLENLPPAPDWLPSTHAVKEWNNTGQTLINFKMLTIHDLPALAQMCALHGKTVQLYAAGESPNASMISSLLAFYVGFGMTPMSRTKIKVAALEKPAGNKFAKNGTRNN